MQDILDGIEDVHFAELTAADVVRHRLVSDIVDAYGRWDADAAAPGGPARATAGRNRPARPRSAAARGRRRP